MSVGMRKIANQVGFHVNSVDIVTNEAIVLHMERLVMLATGLTILQVYASLKKGGSNSGPSDEQAFFIGALSDNKCTENEWYINLKVKEKYIFQD